MKPACQVGECFSFGLQLVSSPPSFFVEDSGKYIMLLFTIVVVLPLCFPKNLTAVRTLPVNAVNLALSARRLVLRGCIIDWTSGVL